MSITRVHINPHIFTWAIGRVGKDVDDYVKNDPKLQDWLDGSKLPTFKNVEQFARKFYVPLGYMFLEEPPQEECPIPFFRSVTSANAQSINVYDTILEIQDRQSWLSKYLRSLDFAEIDYVGQYSLQNSVEEVCKGIRSILNISCHNWAFEFRTIDEALKYITKVIEDKGTIVTYNSVVGFNNSRSIPVSECRGFTLIDKYAPFIFVNSKDAKVAQMFTILHEFAHVLIGYSAGIGNAELSDSSEMENFCDKVAAAFLVPDLLLKELWSDLGEDYATLSKKFKVSRYVIARRAMEMKLISSDRLFQLYHSWKSENVNLNSSNSKGGNFYPSAIKKSSRTFLIHVSNALNRNMLLYMDAYRLTGLKGDTFHKIINSQYFV